MNIDASSMGPREPLPCPHEDCHYHNGRVGNRPGVWLRINEEDAVAMVTAVETAHPHRASLILKRQPWYPAIAMQIKTKNAGDAPAVTG